MNVDMITTFLNDFATFWKNIWKFLEPIFGLAQEKGWEKPDAEDKAERAQQHLNNLDRINKVFGGNGYTPKAPETDNVEG